MNNYKAMLESIYDGIYFVDVERKITFWNKGAEIITGFTADEVIGSFCYDNILNHVDEFGSKLCIHGCPLGKTIEDNELRELMVYLHHKDGHRVKIKTRVTPIVENGITVGAVEVFTDQSNINLLLKEDNIDNYTFEDLKILALYDQLTGLPNRRYLENFLDSRLREYRELSIDFGVLFMDIDHFRDFNNRYGHDLGDKVLSVVSKTYSSSIRQSDLIGRWGGEEFVGVFANISLENLKKVAEKIRMLVENSIIRDDGKAHSVTISIGGTVAKPEDTVDSLIKRADMCMYKSKQNGRNQTTVE